jgi:hypothetical protein
MDEMLADWTSLGDDGTRTKAQLWTWHYATQQGRAYLRSGRRCSGLALLADLIAVDRQVRRPAIQKCNCCSFSLTEVRGGGSG